MARPTLELIRALRVTAERLGSGATYKWSHFGQCNCGNLAQTVTHLTPEQVYRAAFDRSGDWGEQAREFCPTSGYPIDFVLQRLFAMGVEQDDVRHLERLSDDRVLRHMGVQWLAYNQRNDVIVYMRAWADLLEEQLRQQCWEMVEERSAAE